MIPLPPPVKVDFDKTGWSLRFEWLYKLWSSVRSSPLSGAGSPEAKVSAPVGTLYLRTDGGAGTTLYVKESGVGATGWIAK